MAWSLPCTCRLSELHWLSGSGKRSMDGYPECGEDGQILIRSVDPGLLHKSLEYEDWGGLKWELELKF